MQWSHIASPASLPPTYGYCWCHSCCLFNLLLCYPHQQCYRFTSHQLFSELFVRAPVGPAHSFFGAVPDTRFSEVCRLIHVHLHKRHSLVYLIAHSALGKIDRYVPPRDLPLEHSPTKFILIHSLSLSLPLTLTHTHGAHL